MAADVGQAQVPRVEPAGLPLNLSNPAIMADHQTVNELRTAKLIREEDVAKAVDTVMSDRATAAFPITDGYTLDLAAAVAASPFASALVAKPDVSEFVKRAFVCTAMLLARPVKG